MTALTADRNTEYSLGDLLSVPVAASSCIFAGSLVCVNASGYAVPAADTAGFIFVGVATARVDNTAGADGDLSVVVRRRGRFRLAWRGSTLSQAAVGNLAYVVDDQTLDAPDDVTNNVVAGQIVRVASDGTAWVDVDCGARTGGGAWTEPTTTTSGA